MQGLTKWKQNVLHPLNWKHTWLNAAVCVCLMGCVCVCVSVCMHANTYERGEGPLGPCPFAVIPIQALY